MSFGRQSGIPNVEPFVVVQVYRDFPTATVNPGWGWVQGQT
jgi:hypothetical protein